MPGPDEDWTPILKAMRDGDFFVTHRRNPDQELHVGGHRRPSGQSTPTSSGRSRSSFVEVVWGDGKTIDRQIIPATELGAFGTKKFSIPFDASGKAWVRFAVWDSAGNGAFVQPIWLTPSKTTTASSR